MQISTHYNQIIPSIKFTRKAPYVAQTEQREHSKVNPFDSYMEAQAAINAANVKKAKAIEDDSNINAPYKNNLKTMINNNESVILAIIPRMFGATDLNNDRQIHICCGEKPGTFLSCIDRLDSVKELGVNTLHILPIHPPGKRKAMGTAGSVYAPLKYVEDDGQLAIDPILVDFSDPRSPQEQFKAFIDACHEKDIKVMLDLPSCASLDMSKNEPELMALGRHGEDKCPQGWEDIRMFNPWFDETKRVLNPHLLEMHKNFVDSCIELGIDGIRADVARAKPTEFWDILINHSHQKDPEFAWLAETYTYECASPQLNMMYDRPIDLLRAGFDCYYGQYHMFHEMKAEEFMDYVKMNLNLTHRDYEGDGVLELAGKSLIGSFTTHDDKSAMIRGGELFSNLSTIVQTTVPMTNPYYVDGFQVGDAYDYKYGNKDDDYNETVTFSDMEEKERNFHKKVHHNQLDLFNLPGPAQGEYGDISRVMKEAHEIRKEYNELLTKGSFIEVHKKGDKGDWVIPYLRHHNGKTLLVVANKNVNRPISVKLHIPGLKANQVLKNIAPEYGEKSVFQVQKNELSAILAPAKAYIFEIDTPNIEKSYKGEVFKQNFEEHAPKKTKRRK